MALLQASINRRHAHVRQRRVLVANAVGGAEKRVFDVLVAVISLLLLAPLMLAIAVLIKAMLGGPVIYSHARVGQTGKRFQCLKFRSMIKNGDEVLERYLEANPQAANEWQATRKLRHDPRVTTLGHILRKTSIDELPQLVNVLRGEMSCIGPRPIVRAELEKYGDLAPYYLAARPGITGLWQTSGRSNLSYDDRVKLDMYYVRNWSMRMDVKILLRTVGAVIRTGDSA